MRDNLGGESEVWIGVSVVVWLGFWGSKAKPFELEPTKFWNFC
jgi:hypothetical protein